MSDKLHILKVGQPPILSISMSPEGSQMSIACSGWEFSGEGLEDPAPAFQFGTTFEDTRIGGYTANELELLYYKANGMYEFAPDATRPDP